MNAARSPVLVRRMSKLMYTSQVLAQVRELVTQPLTCTSSCWTRTDIFPAIASAVRVQHNLVISSTYTTVCSVSDTWNPPLGHPQEAEVRAGRLVARYSAI